MKGVIELVTTILVVSHLACIGLGWFLCRKYGKKAEAVEAALKG